MACYTWEEEPDFDHAASALFAAMARCGIFRLDGLIQKNGRFVGLQGIPFTHALESEARRLCYSEAPSEEALSRVVGVLYVDQELAKIRPEVRSVPEFQEVLTFAGECAELMPWWLHKPRLIYSEEMLQNFLPLLLSYSSIFAGTRSGRPLTDEEKGVSRG